MTSQAVYCLSLQIRPPEDNVNETSTVANSDSNQQQSASNKTILFSDHTQSAGEGLRGGNGETVIATRGANKFKTATTISAVQQANHIQQVHPANNIILVRGTRSENGHIILQNSHELISLLNGDDENNNGGSTNISSSNVQTGNKTILFQSQRVKQTNGQTSSKFESVNNLKNTILLHQPGTIKTQGQENGTILLQTAPTGQKKNNTSSSTSTTLNDGSILLHPRVTRGSSDGPILLQTLKRLDKSQSILLFRNSANAGQNSKTVVNNFQNSTNAKTFATSTKSVNCLVNGESSSIIGKLNSGSTTITVTNGSSSVENVSINTRSVTSRREQLQNMSIADEPEEKTPAAPQRQTNVPLGTEISETEDDTLLLKREMAGYRQLLPPQNHHQNTIIGGGHHYQQNVNNHGLLYASASPQNMINSGAQTGHQQNQHYNHHHQQMPIHHQYQIQYSNQQQQQQQQNMITRHLMGHHHQLHGFGAQSRALLHHNGLSSMPANVIPLNANGEPIKLPDNLESLPRADHFPTQRHRWNTNEEIAAILISFDRHSEWQSKEVKTRPKSGSMLLYSRKKVRYRRDGYCWKKRKDGKTTREDHMKLKVQGTECIYGCYVHSAILPTFHRRCYWLLQNPDIVLVHYLNVPYPDDNKMAVITPSLALWGDKKEWTKEELVSQLKPMFFSEDEPDATNDIEISTAETVEAIVGQLMEKQRLARQAALVKQLECGCPDSTCADGKSCSHPMRRITAAKNKRVDNSQNQVSSTTPNVLIGPRLYQRWRSRDQSMCDSKDGSSSLGGYQVIPSAPQTSSPSTTVMNISTSQINSRGSNSGMNNSSSANNNCSMQMTNNNNNNNSNNNGNHNSNNRSNIITNLSSIVSNHSNNTNSNSGNNQHQHLVSSHSTSSQNNSNNNNNNSGVGGAGHYVGGHGGSGATTAGQSQHIPACPNQQNSSDNTSENTNNSNAGGNRSSNLLGNHRLPGNSAQQLNNGNNPSTNNNNSNNSGSSSTSGAPPLVLNLSQLQGSNGSLLILNGQQQSFICHQDNQRKDGKDDGKLEMLVPKQEVMESMHSSPEKHQQTPMEVLFDGNFNSSQQMLKKNSQMQNFNNQQSNHQSDNHNDGVSYFNETLDLSHEDIQKTLSANMPLSDVEHVSNVGAINGELNPMDFIDNVAMCDVTSGSVHDDDVFVNLDAFDMFVEFPELELDAKSHYLHSVGENSGHNNHSSSLTNLSSCMIEKSSPETSLNNESHCSGPSGSFTITDYSPEWAYPEGGVKVLVTGPWNTTSSYTVLFDSFPVPTAIVQNGVLRCYCPAHDVGLATLQVACDGYVISNSVIFEYKSLPSLETAIPDGTAIDGLYKFTLLNRLGAIDEKMQIKSEPKDLPEDAVLFSQSNFEDRLVTYCQSLAMRQWSLSLSDWTNGLKGMTLLHLASALGYTKLICTMMRWRGENSSVILEAEIDAMGQDADGYTPLMWACARGHNETAVMLYQWNYKALNLKNSKRLTAIDLAKSNGNYRYNELINQLERLEKERLDRESQGNSSDVKNRHTKSERSEPQANESSPECDSSNASCSSSSSSSMHSNRSHDGVFLRPGAIPSGQSPPSTRLSKRPSVDSGIGIEVSRLNFLRSGKTFNRDSLKLSRFDRSMSLPLSSSINPSNSLGDSSDHFSLNNDVSMDMGCNTLLSSSLLSPLRKMDFALCEVSAGDSSPIGGQDGSGLPCDEDDELDHHQDNNCENVMQEGGVVGDSDAKVLTLAEQIIAAMPERIKNESEEMMTLGSPLPDSLMSDSASIGVLSDSFMEPLLDQIPSSNFEHEFNFEFSDHNYRYHDVGTPCSSLSPASSGPLQSPASYSLPPDPPMGSPSPPPTTQDFTEFLQASSSTPKPFEADFSNLTLTDREQRELYEAAKCIQKAYRSYKGRKKLEEQDKERSAAIVIQNYYRRYKQYMYYRQMTHAALVIQNGYRSYCENKRFKKNQNTQPHTMVSDEQSNSSDCLQNFHKNYQNETAQLQSTSSTPKELSPSGPLKRTYSQRTQNQAARKIQQFMRQSKMNAWEDNLSFLATERASRKREANPPTHQGGIPPKLSVTRVPRSSLLQRHSHAGSCSSASTAAATLSSSSLKVGSSLSYGHS